MSQTESVARVCKCGLGKYAGNPICNAAFVQDVDNCIDPEDTCGNMIGGLIYCCHGRACHEPATPTCNCNMRTKLVGDGCSVCNPEYAADHEPVTQGQQDGAEVIEAVEDALYQDGRKWEAIAGELAEALGDILVRLDKINPSFLQIHTRDAESVLAKHRSMKP